MNLHAIAVIAAPAVAPLSAQQIMFPGFGRVPEAVFGRVTALFPKTERRALP